jgi:hypothetical protein
MLSVDDGLGTLIHKHDIHHSSDLRDFRLEIYEVPSRLGQSKWVFD